MYSQPVFSREEFMVKIDKNYKVCMLINGNFGIANLLGGSCSSALHFICSLFFFESMLEKAQISFNMTFCNLFVGTHKGCFNAPCIGGGWSYLCWWFDFLWHDDDTCTERELSNWEGIITIEAYLCELAMLVSVLLLLIFSYEFIVYWFFGWWNFYFFLLSSMVLLYLNQFPVIPVKMNYTWNILISCSKWNTLRVYLS